MIGLVALVSILGAGSIILGDNHLASKSSRLKELRTESEALDQQQLLLINAKRDLAEFDELEMVSKSIVPQDKDQAKTIRELLAIASEAEIPIEAISFPDSSLGEVTRRGSGDQSSRQQASITQATPVEGVTGLFVITINLSVGQTVTYDQLINFLEKLEQNRRTAQVASLSIDPDSNDRNLVTFNVSINVYVKP